ncbi:UDP-2,3-diacylglucosamine diphosphatase [Reichenbachiella versicolor]|uniref:UDP-2,3-diacylglucosamine diphosphatase n=1 Tax=Reichenbachiella versicolor TaxID=1821036 RepID=UPI000D6E627C|nr:UDP-2,3-diacylglucosamine diphosphatase [Reichenbachiella versicolor]
MSIQNIQLTHGDKIYFASDFHLGAPNIEASKERESKILKWLDLISEDAKVLFLVGDIFDFWFEYNHVVSRGSIRFLGKLAELSDKGIRIILFSGNHDIWYRDYLHSEFDIELVYKPQTYQLGTKKFYIAHGDGLGKGDTKFKILKSFFTNKLCIWLFKWVHPDLGISLAKLWSKYSKAKAKDNEIPAKEQRLIEYSSEIEKKEHHDYYLYGDVHKEAYVEINSSSHYVNLGEWIKKKSFGVFDGSSFQLNYFDE